MKTKIVWNESKEKQKKKGEPDDKLVFYLWDYMDVSIE